MAWDLQGAIAYYAAQGAPRDQNALIHLLKEIRQETGKLRQSDLAQILEAYQIPQSLLLALIRRVPGLQLEDSHCLELCAGPNCSRRAALAAFVEKNYGASPQGFSVKFVPCMRLCGKGPNIRWDGQLYHQADEALLQTLLAPFPQMPNR